MNQRSVVIIGLPASGKTTFLAALWHLVTAREVPTVMQFRTLNAGNGRISTRSRRAGATPRCRTAPRSQGIGGSA